MIDERINRTLNELERNLGNVESARKQVESTVNSFNGLKAKTQEYVNSLSTIKTNLGEIVNLVGNDYKQKSESFENDRKNIMEACNNAIHSVNSAAGAVQEEVKENIANMQKRFTFVIVLNIIILITVVVLAFFVK